MSSVASMRDFGLPAHFQASYLGSRASLISERLEVSVVCKVGDKVTMLPADAQPVVQLPCF